MTQTNGSSSEELSQEQIDWLNDYVSKEDLKKMGLTRKQNWLKYRRWQMYNVAIYTMGERPIYGPSYDVRFLT